MDYPLFSLQMAMLSSTPADRRIVLTSAAICTSERADKRYGSLVMKGRTKRVKGSGA
jgi:hypothetical protein